jgi:hypothetical protein
MCLSRYGSLSGRFGAEDAEFPMPVMADFINDAHRKVAERTRCYRTAFTENLPLGSGGKSTVSLDCNIIDIVPESVEISYASEWRSLANESQHTLTTCLGPLRQLSNGTPQWYFTRVGSALDAQRVMEIVPGSDTAVTSGVRFEAYIYPALLTAETHAFALQPAENEPVLYGVCRRMAEVQLAKGRQDAVRLVQYFGGKEDEEIRRLSAIIAEAKHPGNREIRYDASSDWMSW